MVNYQLVKAEYQVVAGINVRLTYKGVDKYSTITATMGFDLKSNAKILQIEAGCQPGAASCSKTAAWEYFNAIEAMIISHP